VPLCSWPSRSSKPKIVYADDYAQIFGAAGGESALTLTVNHPGR
jgi:hypothetical protein